VGSCGENGFDRAVAAGCTVSMPMNDAFWGDRFGKFSDPFGHSWSVAHTIEVLSQKEVEARGQKWMAEHAAKKDGVADAPKTKPASPSKAASPKAKSPRKK